jgi:hypothetical protein
MIPSMFSLDHRLSELRPTAGQLRLARELREAEEAARQPIRPFGEPDRRRTGSRQAPGSTRLAIR